MPAPQVRVWIAFASAPDDPVQDWTDVTAYLASDPISCSRGRSDEMSAVEPGTASLVLKNDGGEFTWGSASSPFYPNVVPGKRIRIEVSADGVTWWPRFDGQIAGWPMAVLSPLANQVRTSIAAVDRLGKFGAKRRLRDPLAEEFGTSSAQTGARLG